jgi:hypothetical protein
MFDAIRDAGNPREPVVQTANVAVLAAVVSGRLDRR